MIGAYKACNYDSGDPRFYQQSTLVSFNHEGDLFPDLNQVDFIA